MKLRAKILLTLLPLVIAPLALLAAIAAKDLQQAREQGIAAHLLRPIEAVASRFQWIMRGVRGDLTALARLHNDAAESGPQTLYSEIQRSFRLTQQTRAGYLDLMLRQRKRRGEGAFSSNAREQAVCLPAGNSRHAEARDGRIQYAHIRR